MYLFKNHSRPVVFFLIPLIFHLIASGAEGGKNRSTVSFYHSNNYYFQDPVGKPIILVGDYTWETFSGVNFNPAFFVRLTHLCKSPKRGGNSY